MLLKNSYFTITYSCLLRYNSCVQTLENKLHNLIVCLICTLSCRQYRRSVWTHNCQICLMFLGIWGLGQMGTQVFLRMEEDGEKGGGKRWTPTFTAGWTHVGQSSVPLWRCPIPEASVAKHPMKCSLVHVCGSGGCGNGAVLIPHHHCVVARW